MRAKKRLTTRPNKAVARPSALVADVRALIDEARGGVARAVNSALVGLYWSIGKRVREDVLQEQRARYGEQIVTDLSAALTTEFGRATAGRTSSA